MGYLTIFFCFLNHSSQYTMLGSSYMGEIALVSIWFRMACTHIITQLYKEFCHLDISTIYQHLTSNIFLVPMGKFFDVHY